MSKTTNDGLTRSGRHRMLCSCTHVATVGVKGNALYVDEYVDIRAKRLYHCCVGFQRDNEARDSFSANHGSDRLNVTATPEMTSVTCNCACHGSRDVIEALRSELRSAKHELTRCREQLATLRQTEAKLRQRYTATIR